MVNVIDRRLNTRDKNLANRQRFIERTKEQIKRAVTDAVSEGKIKDITGNIKVPIRGTSEPIFGHDHKSGHRHFVVPGNKEYVEKDIIPKPQSGDGSGTEGSPDGLDEDNFVFTLTKDEFLNFFFDDLELPDLVKRQISDIKKFVPRRAGYSSIGNPAQLDIRYTLRNAMGRRLALDRPKIKEIEDLEKELALWQDAMPTPFSFTAEQIAVEIKKINDQLAIMRRRIKAIPWIDPFDVRYRNFELQPRPITRCVMFCVMDVSGSMAEREKDIAKRFFMLLYMFLTRKYENVAVVFVRHHSTAEECNEQDFFYKKETGGTVVSTGLQLVSDILQKRFSVDSWNIYVAQASDGDNYSADNPVCRDELFKLLPNVQYFAYLDIPQEGGLMGVARSSELWTLYLGIAKSFRHPAMLQAMHQRAIWGVFKELFSKSRQKVTA